MLHGMSKTRPYRIRANMITRCYSPKHLYYKNYGGRGITVCERWRKSFVNFWEDMKEGYRDDLQIDRIDNDKGYYKENCRWVTPKVQSNNRKYVNKITFNGLVKNLTEWAEYLGVKRSMLATRYYVYKRDNPERWPLSRILTK